MNTNKLYNKSDEVVKLRQGMEIILREGVKRGNMGDKNYIHRALNRISTYDNYSIKTRLEHGVKIDNIIFEAGEKVISVVEGNKNIFYIYVDPKNRVTKLYTNPYDLMTNEELKNKPLAEANAILMQEEWKHQDTQMRNKVMKRRNEALRSKNPYY